MLKKLRSFTFFVLILSSCVSSSRNGDKNNIIVSENGTSLDLTVDSLPISLTELPRTEDGGFIMSPGFYEAEFKTFCLQPGTPDPTPRDAYHQAPISGFRKDIVETVLLNSRSNPGIKQKNVQLLLWSIVSRSDFNKLSSSVKEDAMDLLTSKQIFELKGGVMGAIKQASNSLPNGIIKGNTELSRLFEIGSSSYEMFEKIAVLREPSIIRRADFKNDQWYKQKENYYVRHFPVSYQKVRIQVYVPDSILDSAGKVAGEYLVFDPAGYQTVPVNSNSQRLGIGGPVLDIIRSVIRINKQNIPPKKLPDNKDIKAPSKS